MIHDDSTLTRFTRLLTVFILLALGLAVAQEDSVGYGGRPRKAAEAKKRYEADREVFKDNKDVLVLPGLVADRKTKQIRILIETTGLIGNSAAEYLVVHVDSSHGYESVAWSYAKPSNIHKALEFIGTKAGHSVDPSRLQFWSKGERIIASIKDAKGNSFRAEELVYDTGTKKTLPKTGFIFTGSIRIKDPKDKKKTIYLADSYDPRSILPAYNEPASVLDASWQASKGQYYESHVVNPNFSEPANTLMTLILEPEMKNGESRIAELKLTVADGKFHLTGSDGKTLNSEPTFEGVLNACQGLIKKGKELYVSTTFNEAMKLAEIHAIAKILALTDIATGLRQEPPAAGRLYYRAFVPNPRWRIPANRMTQPWELHLEKVDDRLTGTMYMYDEEWLPGQADPKLSKRSYPVATPEDVRTRIDKEDRDREKQERRSAPPVLLIYAPADLAYGELLTFIKPAIQTHNAVHVYLEGAPSARE